MRSQTEESHQQRILQVLVYIQQHLDEAMPLETLARVAHFSSYHFHRIFRGMVGESVKEHIRRLRLERAAHRLKSTDQPVMRIAFEAGYEAHESFTRAFRTMFGESPSGFRKIHRKLPPKASPSGVHYAADGKVDNFRLPPAKGAPLHVRIETIERMHVAFMRHVGPYDEIGATWEKFMAWAGGRGLLGSRPIVLGLVHDDPEVTPPERIRYDACLVARGSFEGEGDVGIQRVGGGEWAIATHRGPHGRLRETYVQLCRQWLPDSGRELRSSPAFEVYRNSPQDTAPEELLTDIHLPLK